MHAVRSGGRGAARLLVALILAALMLPLAAASTAAATVEARASVQPASVAKGSTASIKVEVQNNSSRSGYATIYTYVRSPSGSTVTYSRATRALMRGQWTSVALSYRVPSNAATGTYRVDVKVSGIVSYSKSGLATFSVTGGTGSTPAPSPSPTPTPAPQPSGGTNLDQMEAEFLTLLNNYRKQNGLPALMRNSKLDAASYKHSRDMAARRYFSHNTPEGKTPWTRMAEAGYTCNGYKGENIAAGYSSAQAVFNGWKSSSGHNKNMLSSNFSEIGIGLAYSATSPYKYYWTTDFGRCL